MKDRQKLYLDKIVKLLVDDTRLGRGKGQYWFHTPFRDGIEYIWEPSLPIYVYYGLSKYCFEQFSLTEEETDYVWDQYKSIIDDEIKNYER